ncbi:MAG: enoyl-CoA hydratase/isomerase family protein [Solirubrobacteraceae bacterium]|nr:enoyl-CoA hydratase/isomerase family protein [Solirubrobacteraceae bacterium]
MSSAPVAAPEHLRVERTGAVLTITIDRPERMNATSTGTGQALLAAVNEAAAGPAVRAIVLTGAGRAFSAGADLRAMDGPALPDGRPDLAEILRGTFNPLVLAIRAAPKPVIAAVGGPAVGVGCSLALACDLMVVSRSAKLIAGFANVGLSLDGGLSLLLARKAGSTRAAHAALVGTPIDGEQALAWGLANELVADDALQAAAAALAARLAKSAPGALAASKKLLGAVIDEGLAAALEREAISQGGRVDSPEFVEGVSAFLERRAPDFG